MSTAGGGFVRHSWLLTRVKWSHVNNRMSDETTPTFYTSAISA